MKLNDILSAAGKHKARKRVGRGTGSGRGKTSGRGTKGMGARAGSGIRLAYEGGQNPALMRIPQRGFSNARFRKEFQTVNVSDLERFEAGAQVDAQVLAQANLISDAAKPVKILGDGSLSRKLTVVADAFSASAKQKIEQAGGSAQPRQ
jgi:large subunit ribosomal protein L15